MTNYSLEEQIKAADVIGRWWLSIIRDPTTRVGQKRHMQTFKRFWTTMWNPNTYISKEKRKPVKAFDLLDQISMDEYD